MQHTIYQIDAFSDRIFRGNPAAVVPLEKWLSDAVMQNIALENNLSETAFFVPVNGGYHIRWFTPVAEVSLCGHATLASAHVLFNHLDYKKNKITFQSRSGLLKVIKEGKFLVLDFPASELKKTGCSEKAEQAFGIKPRECLKGREDLMFVFHYEEDIRNLQPNLQYIKTLDAQGIIATAPSVKYDFVSRYFAPREGIDEDPVTGSAHTMLVPFWANKLGKTTLLAKQLSTRGGTLRCQSLDERVKIAGEAVTYMEGKIFL